IPIIVYTGRALSKSEARRLEAYAESVVLKEGSSMERLLEEIRLFFTKLQKGEPTRRQAMMLAQQATGGSIVGKKILGVDDDMRTVYALSALLQSKGYEVLVADTGKVALETLAQNPSIDAVLMDIMMPEMDGYEAMRRIRENSKFAQLPIIAL